MITTVLTDLDGTLIPFEQEDFVKLYFSELSAKLAPLGYEPKATVKAVWAGMDAMQRNNGAQPNSKAFWDTFRALTAGLPDAKALCDSFYTAEFDKVRACLKYGANRRGLIERLKSAGLRVVLATNPVFPADGVRTRLGWIGLCEEDFELITTYENSTRCKPSAEYYTEILRKIGVSPADALMIGNNVCEDIRAAQSAGLDAFLVTEFLENPQGEDTGALRRGTLDEAVEYAIYNA